MVQRNALVEMTSGCLEGQIHLVQSTNIQFTSWATGVEHGSIVEISAKYSNVCMAVVKVLEQGPMKVRPTSRLVHPSGEITIDHQDEVHS